MTAASPSEPEIAGTAGMTSLPGLVPHASAVTVPVVENVRIAQDTWRLRLACPEIAARVTPGQFFMVREPGTTEPLLGRPFALYDTWLDVHDRLAGIDIVYLVVGKMTQTMTHWRPADLVEIWGPLGNGFPTPDCENLLLVAGGIGNTPFLAVGREALGGRSYGRPARQLAAHPKQVRFCYGARSCEYLAGVDDFAAAGIDLKLATDDGSAGHHGFVTSLVRETLAAWHATAPEMPGTRATRIYCCGPERMMEAVAQIAEEAGVECWLSLETPMACGFGACFSCVTKVRQDDGTWDYRRTCVEGPIFRSRDLCFDDE
jgi:dihydroorotate dehydrogenase electron transfer subunit